jgi:hypothetical protein
LRKEAKVAQKVIRGVHVCTCQECHSHPYSKHAQEHRAINRVVAGLDERNRRRFVGLLAVAWGPGAIQPLSVITGLSRKTVRRGRQEIEHPRSAPLDGRVRCRGGGRKAIEKNSRPL